MPVDLVLSSGFLAFARQAGFLAAVEDLGIGVEGVCGTSSGALAGALWAAGWSAEQVLTELTARAPLAQVRPSLAPWRGALSMEPVVRRLREVLPATFEGLERPFGVGVCVAGGHRLITSGPLPEAVAASCALPYVFAPVSVEGCVCSDGGAVDRTALSAWRAHRGGVDVVLHLVDRTAGAERADDLDAVRVVRSGRSGARLWHLGDAAGQFAETRAAVIADLQGHNDRYNP